VPVRDLVLIFVAGACAGAINAVAGGGTLVSFPVLLWLGRDPIVANASNAVALWPASLASAFAFRRELAAAPRLLRWLLPTSAVGAALGGWLLLATPTRLFSALVPFLILAATLLIALKRPLLAVRRVRAADAVATIATGTTATSAGAVATIATGTTAPAAATGPTPAASASDQRRGLLALAAAQLLVAIYGGYFGAAMGIMMLATFGLFGLDDIHQRNGLKNVAATLINGVASLVFVAGGAVDWRDAGVLGAGAIVGGYLGAVGGRRLPARAAEALVVAIGIAAALGQLMRR
jgi:uncharacterized protein